MTAIVVKKTGAEKLIDKARETFFDKASHSYPTVGTEIELKVVDKNTGENVEPSKIERILNEHKERHGLKDDPTYRTPQVTTDMGSVEIVLPWAKEAHIIGGHVHNTREPLSDSFAREGIVLLGYGFDPVTAPKRENTFSKNRYHILEKISLTDYLQASTAGLQVHTAAQSMQNVIDLKRVADAFTPVFYAMFANSPIWSHEQTDENVVAYLHNLKSVARFAGWSHAMAIGYNQKRYGTTQIESPDEYFDRMLSLDVVMLEREGEAIAVSDVNGKPITFREFLVNGEAYGMDVPNPEKRFRITPEFPNDVYFASGTDWLTARYHPKHGTVENRMFDSLPAYLVAPVTALMQGLANNLEEATRKAQEWLKLGIPEIEGEKALRHGYDATIYGQEVQTLARQVVEIASKGLQKPNSLYMDPIKEMVAQKMSPADRIMKEGGDIQTLIRLTKY